MSRAQKRAFKQKLERHRQKLDMKEREKFADRVLEKLFPVVLQATKDVFKEQATNEKCEELTVRIMYLLEHMRSGDVSLKTLAESVDTETGIRYDFETGNIENMQKEADKDERDVGAEKEETGA